MPSTVPSPDRFLPAVAVETAGRPGEVALATAPDAVHRRALGAGGDLAADLLPALEGLVREARISPDALRLVVLGTGPGSFTGLRAGAAVALVLAAFLPAPLVALPSLEGSPLLARSGRVALCLDALRGEVQGAVYNDGREEIAPYRDRPAGFAGRLADTGVLAGSGVDQLSGANLVPPGWEIIATGWEPRADLLLRRGLARAKRGEWSASPVVDLLYLRPAAAAERRGER
jgi:tRNA threonylcarbamoyl adenosine modification protein YeaZ